MSNRDKKNDILILTQKVDANDDLLGFMYGWIWEFAKHCDKVTVIALGVGKYDLPHNVRVVSLGKDLEIKNYKLKIIKKFFYIKNFFKYIWQERKNYDKVFVHMNKEYVVLGGIFWRLWKKKIGFWYVHKRKGFKLWLAEKLANVIFTASRESFNIKSKKVKIIGHGIDIDKFSTPNTQHPTPNTQFKIIYVGRISRIKNQALLVKAMDCLVNKQGVKNIQVNLVGSPVYKEDEIYQTKLKELVQKKNLGSYINFVGSVPNKEMINIYSRADLSINLCPTGGMDKVVLESMASGIPVIVLNKTFAPILKEWEELLILDNEDESELAEKIKKIIDWPGEEKKKMVEILRETVIKDYSLDNLIKNILKDL